jgi:hypothetical protein
MAFSGFFSVLEGDSPDFLPHFLPRKKIIAIFFENLQFSVGKRQKMGYNRRDYYKSRRCKPWQKKSPLSSW